VTFGIDSTRTHARPKRSAPPTLSSGRAEKWVAVWRERDAISPRQRVFAANTSVSRSGASPRWRGVRNLYSECTS